MTSLQAMVSFLNGVTAGRFGINCIAMLFVCACSITPGIAQTHLHSSQEAAGEIVYYEDHFDTFHNWDSVPDPCRARYGNEGLELTISKPGASSCIVDLFGAGYFSGNIRIDVYVKPTRGSLNAGYDIVFGHNDRNVVDDYRYVIDAGAGKYALFKETANDLRPIVPWTADDSIKHLLNQENHLMIEISGRSVRLYANGKHIRSVTLDSDIRGYIGFVVDDNLTVAFRHLRVASFLQSAGGHGPEPTFQVAKSFGMNVPVGRRGFCIFNRSQDYLTLDRLPSANAPCALTTSSTMATVHIVEDSGAKHIRIEGTARLLEGSDAGGYGLEFSIPYGGVKTNYYLHVSGNGSVAVFMESNGNWQRPIGWKAEELVHTGYNVDNHLAVEIVGTGFYCYVNGKYVGSVRIPTPDVADFGYAVDFESLSAAFKNIEFTRIID